MNVSQRAGTGTCRTVFLGEIGLRVFVAAPNRVILGWRPRGGRVKGEEREGKPEPEIKLRRAGHDCQR